MTENEKSEFLDKIWKDRLNDIIKFPIEQPSFIDSVSDFNNLKNKSFTSLIKQGEWFSRYEYQYKKNDIYIDMDNTGLKSSDYYHFYSRMACDSINSPSPKRVWENEKFFKSMASALLSMKLYEPTKSNLKTCISLRKYIASQFRPSAVKCLYEIFNATDILDFSSGWGDRLTAFMATKDTVSYTGIDPNNSLYEGYNNQIKNNNINKNINMNLDCAESFVHQNKYDFVFTSPPYFNIEKYSNDMNQSFKKYKKLDVWLNDFLFKSIHNLWVNLKDDAIVMINISDVYSNHTINNICDPMNDFISSLPNSKYLGCIGYRMQKRLNSKSSNKGIFCEPIWIFTNGKKCLNDFLVTA